MKGHNNLNLVEKSAMIAGRIQTLFQLWKPSTQTLQILHSLLLKTSLDRHEHFFFQLMLSATSVSLCHARQLFDCSPIVPPPLFAWNLLIRAYAKSSSVPEEAVTLFANLQRTIGTIKPDHFTYPFVIMACGRCSMLGVGGSVHSLVLKSGFTSVLPVRNTLLTMYGGCGAVELARNLFDEMHVRDVVSWSSFIASYVECNLDSEALRVFKDMIMANEKPNMITLVTLRSACTNLLNIRLGKPFHSYILINAVEMHVGLGTALLSMYAKCGHLDEAVHIFNSIPHKNLQCWTVMISCLANNGRGEEAVTLFGRMEEAGFKPDSMSFSTALSGCSHGSLLDKGKELFQKMVNTYKIKPTMEHYGCMVDLFGRHGMIEEAYGIIMSMPMEPNSVILRSYLNACLHHDCAPHCVDERLLKLLIEREPEIGANYVLAASVACKKGYWNDLHDMRNDMKVKGVKKVAGYSWVVAAATDQG